MPYKPKVPCRHPCCPNLVPAGQKYCEEHKALHPEESRSAATKGYGARWRLESKKFLALHPLCEECLKEGKATPVSDVDLLVSATVPGLRFFGMVEELRQRLGKKVDVLDQKQLTGNFELTSEILRDGIKIYG